MIEEFISMALRNIICVAVFLTHVLILVSADKARNFTIKLHPIDSPKLPFFPKNLTPQERYQIRVEMSKARASRLSSSMTKSRENISNVTVANSTELSINPVPMVQSYIGHYAAEISIGVPPQLMYLLADTGSDLTWVQCDGCDPCFPINETAVQNFEFQFSKTYRNLPSNNPFCQGTHDLCQFTQPYISGQVIEGVLATDAFILGPESEGNDLIPGVIFGCGLRSNEHLEFDPPEANIITGILGLGRAPISILKQKTELQQSIGYCIPPDSKVEPLEDHIYLNFGYDGNIEGDIHITYFLQDSPHSYYLTLNGISVNGQKLEIEPALFQVNRSDWSGGFVIDSGSRHTFLIRPAYDAFEAAVIQYFANKYGLVPAESPFDDTLCFGVVEGVEYEFPSITLHLEGADFVADSSGTFNVFGGLLCMNFFPSDAKSIWGSTLMFNYRFIYDLQGGFVLFCEETCPGGDGE